MTIRPDVPLSEQYRLAGERWADLDAAATMLEECKSSFLSQQIMKHADLPVNRAEAQAKAGIEWREYIIKMVKAREAANIAKVELEFLRMRHAEWQSAEANARAERKMG